MVKANTLFGIDAADCKPTIYYDSAFWNLLIDQYSSELPGSSPGVLNMIRTIADHLDLPDVAAQEIIHQLPGIPLLMTLADHFRAALRQPHRTSQRPGQASTYLV